MVVEWWFTWFVVIDVVIGAGSRAPGQRVVGHVGAAVDGQQQVIGASFLLVELKPIVSFQIERIGTELDATGRWHHPLR